MPVPDTEPHPTTIREAGHKPSCYNRGDFWMGHVGETRVYSGNEWRRAYQWIPHTMTTECQIAKAPLAECAGCKHIKEKEGCSSC